MPHEITLKQARDMAFQAECILFILANSANEMNEAIREGLTDAALFLCGYSAAWLGEEMSVRRGNNV